MVAGTRTAGGFLAALESLSSDDELRKYKRAFPLATRGSDRFLGVPMGSVFELARASVEMPLDEVERLLESPWHEARAGAVGIMDYQARLRTTTPEQRRELYELYLRRHDRIDSWDLVDRAAIHVVGGYLADRPRDPLYALARSSRPLERRTAIVASMYFLGTEDSRDLFEIAELLANDPDESVQKATGWALRAAGNPELEDFLDHWAPRMARVALRYAVEKLPKVTRERYLKAS
ncbi:DNA alkylation repair protein [Sinomonas notoginsengisoli]|uniref:DNA alkylation repair protein n=1 Tax=Sinomonas notoginsengisoli TaxID=1457311 RepID=UPI001F3C8A29|nr:DNA alkylation repair protein [Sinomonas notoginsengisoli]